MDTLAAEPREWKGQHPTPDEIEEVVFKAMDAYFQKKGKMTFSVIVGASVLVGALTVLFGGIKTLLAWAGFTYIR